MRYLLIIPLFFFLSCGNKEAEQKTDSAKASCSTSPLNPNGDSELAILMREMANYTDSCRSALVGGREVPSAPESIKDLLTAKKTDNDLDTALFRSMGILYQNQVEAFESSKAEDKVRMFNAMVQACKNCHENFCHGPLVRINRMFITEK